VVSSARLRPIDSGTYRCDARELVAQSVSRRELLGLVERQVSVLLGSSVADEDVGVGGEQANLLHRERSDPVADHVVDVPVCTGEVAACPVSEGQLLLRERPVPGLVLAFELDAGSRQQVDGGRCRGLVGNLTSGFRRD
jgi:hypothetical protein